MNMIVCNKCKNAKIATRLETVIEQLYKSISPIGGKEQVGIICEQITVLRGVAGEMKGGGANG